MRIAAFYDFYGDRVRPLNIIIRMESGELDWSSTLYFPVHGPFEHFEPEDYGDLPGVSVLLEDLVTAPEEGESEIRQYLGIHLPSIARRHGTDICLFMIQMGDMVEVLNSRR